MCGGVCKTAPSPSTTNTECTRLSDCVCPLGIGLQTHVVFSIWAPISLFASLSLSFSPSLSLCMPFFAVLCEWHTRAHTQLTATTAPAAFCMLRSLPVLSHHWPCTVNHLYLFIRWQAIWESFIWICIHHFLGLCQCCFCWRAKWPPNWKKNIKIAAQFRRICMDFLFSVSKMQLHIVVIIVALLYSLTLLVMRINVEKHPLFQYIRAPCCD